MRFGLSIAFIAPEEYAPLAKAAEAAGFYAASLSDHLIYPKTLSKPYPYTEDGVPRFTETDNFPDPWIAVAAMAAVTTTLRFYTNVFVLPMRNPFHVAKTLASVSCFSNGRVALGIGMGWMPEEFACAGEAFEKRGARADEMLSVMKALWTGDMVEHHGRFYDFPPVRMRPMPVKPIPIYVGGFSEPALRRAARADGWISDLHTVAELKALSAKVDAYRADLGFAAKPYEKLSFGCMDAYDLDGFRRMADAGTTVCTTMPWVYEGHAMNAPLADKIEGIKRFGEKIVQPMR